MPIWPITISQFSQTGKKRSKVVYLPVNSVINLIWYGWCSCFDWPIIMIRPHALRLIVSRLFTVPVLGAGFEKSKITELCTWKKFLRGHILSTAGDAVISVRASRYGTASMLCSNSGNSSISHPPPWPCFSDMNVVTICCNGSAYYCLLAVRGSRGWMSKSDPV